MLVSNNLQLPRMWNFARKGRGLPPCPSILSLTKWIERLDPLGAPNAEESYGRLDRGEANRGLLSLLIRWAGVPPMEALGFRNLFFPAMLRGKTRVCSSDWRWEEMVLGPTLFQTS